MRGFYVHVHGRVCLSPSSRINVSRSNKEGAKRLARQALADADGAVNKSSLYSCSWRLCSAFFPLSFLGPFEAARLQVKLMRLDIPRVHICGLESLSSPAVSPCSGSINNPEAFKCAALCFCCCCLSESAHSVNAFPPNANAYQKERNLLNSPVD